MTDEPNARPTAADYAKVRASYVGLGYSAALRFRGVVIWQCDHVHRFTRQGVEDARACAADELRNRRAQLRESLTHPSADADPTATQQAP